MAVWARMILMLLAGTLPATRYWPRSPLPGWPANPWHAFPGCAMRA